MVAFVNLPIHLCELGFPAVLGRGLRSERGMFSPGRYLLGWLPVPVSDACSSQQGAGRKLGLGPWGGSSSGKGLPFFVSMPTNGGGGVVITSEGENIGKFETNVNSRVK